MATARTGNMIVYFIQAHRGEQQVRELVEMLLAAPDSFVIVSYDSQLPELLRLNRPNYMAKTAGRKIHRGDFSPVAEYLDALQWLRDERIAYDWFVNLCGQTLPLKPVEEIAAEIGGLKCDAIMHHFAMFSPDSDWSAGEATQRVHYQYRKLSNRPLSRSERGILKAVNAVAGAVQSRYRLSTSYGLQIGKRSRPPDDLKFFGGSYFKYLSRKCGEFLLEYRDHSPERLAYFQRILVPDEIFAQTVLVNQPFNISGENKMYFRFAGKRGGHPEPMDESDIGRTADCHFARKFEYQSPAYRRITARIIAGT